jgi:hypothetical protein
LQRHLDAGKGVAVYENADLGHPMIGHKVALTYGTPEAQFEPEQFPDGPPEQCPDGLMREITGGINWRYRLCAVVPPSVRTPGTPEGYEITERIQMNRPEEN